MSGAAGRTGRSEGESLVRECYDRAVALLKANTTPAGVIACAPSEKAAGRHYASIFGRDAAICAIGMVETGDPGLSRVAKNSLLTLAAYQAANGQIPKYVKPESGEADFWYAGCIDATLWWLLAVRAYEGERPEEGLRRELGPAVAKALAWLTCQEHPGLHLVQQNEASDWADIMPRSGFVLYSNVLWYRVKVLYGIESAVETRKYFRLIFNPFGKAAPSQRRARVLMHYVRNRAKASDFYLSFVNLSFWGEELDVFGNILAGLYGLAAPSKACRMVARLRELRVHRPYPVRVVQWPIRTTTPLWRLYMQRHRQNIPYQYHNGGIWPFVGGFWVLLQAQLRMEREARRELERLALVNSLDDWGFNEWLHGKTGKPMGMAGQSWNAATYLMAFQAVHRPMPPQHSTRQPQAPGGAPPDPSSRQKKR